MPPDGLEHPASDRKSGQSAISSGNTIVFFFTRCENRRAMANDSTITAAANAAKISEAEIAEAVQNPASFSVDGLQQSNRSLSELIAADKYLRMRNRAARRRHPLSGIGIAHAIPPGPCDR